MFTKLITAVATEPITLAEVLAQIRQNTSDLAGSVTMEQSIAPGSHNAATHTGSSSDIYGYTPLILLEAGTCGGGGTIDVTIKESDDDDIYTNWSTFTRVTTVNDNITYEKAYTGSKRYIKAVAVVAGVACEFAVSILLYAVTSGESDLINAKIQTAREYGEDYTNHAFAPQTWDAITDEFPVYKDYIEWSFGPLTVITHFKYVNSDNKESSLTEDTDYVVDSDSFPGKIYLVYGKNWPSFIPRPYNAITIRGVCGYTGTAPYILPHNFKQAMLLHVGLMFRFRDEEIPQKAMMTVNSLYDLRGVGRL